MKVLSVIVSPDGTIKYEYICDHDYIHKAVMIAAEPGYALTLGGPCCPEKDCAPNP